MESQLFTCLLLLHSYDICCFVSVSDVDVFNLLICGGDGGHGGGDGDVVGVN